MKRNFNYHDLLGDENPLLKYPQLLDAAIDEFSQKKYEEASLNDILKQADFSKGSLYHHFGDKFGLYLALMDIIIKKKMAFFIPIIKENEDSGNFFSTMKVIIRGTMEFMNEDERLHHLFNRNIEAGDEIKRQLIEYFPYDYNAGFKVIIENAINSGQINPKYSSDFVAKILEILFSNADKLISVNHTKEEIVDTINLLVDFMQTGISNK